MAPQQGGTGYPGGSSQANQTGGTGGGGGGGGGPNNDGGMVGPTGFRSPDSFLVLRVNIILVAVIVFIALLRLPRGIARFWKADEWMSGYFLKNRKFTPNTARVARVQYPTSTNPSMATVVGKGASSSSAESHFYYTAPSRPAQRVDEKGFPVKLEFPPHVSSCPSFLHAALRRLRVRVFPGYSLGKVLICVYWFGALVFPALFRTTGPLTDSTRVGWITISQLPLVVAFAAKGNMFGWILAVGYERLNFLHRFLGRMVVLAANIHGCGYMYKWLIAKTFQQSIARPMNHWGLVSLLCMDCLFFFSTAWWRKNFYRFFLFTHSVFFGLLLFGLMSHYPSIRPFVFMAILVHITDRLTRLIKTRVTTAYIRPIPELGLTRVECPNITAGWRAGQHVRLKLLTFGLGPAGWMETHPFTIASAANSGEGMVLMCKKAGNWTTKMYDFAGQPSDDDSPGRKVQVLIEGPFGGPGHTMFASFSAAIFFAGGSGITFALSAIQELVQKDLKGRSRTRVIDLVWVVQDPDNLVPLLPQFTSLIQQSSFASIRIAVHYTRASAKRTSASDFYHPQLSISACRPNILSSIEATLADASAKAVGHRDGELPQGLLVTVCGPTALADDVAGAVGQVNQISRDQIGGLELYEESFGW